MKFIPGNPKSHGFTILELIIVVIIVGLLASLALPRYLLLIEQARIVEAQTNIKFLREAVERCYVMHGGTDCFECVGPPPFSKLSIDDPGASPNAHFTYEVYCAGNAGSGYVTSINALRNTYELASGVPVGPPNAVNFFLNHNTGWTLQCGQGLYKSIGACP